MYIQNISTLLMFTVSFKIYYHERMAGGSTMASMAMAVADITIILDLVTR